MAGNEDQPAQAETDAGEKDGETVGTEEIPGPDEQTAASPPAEPEPGAEPTDSDAPSSASGKSDGTAVNARDADSGTANRPDGGDGESDATTGDADSGTANRPDGGDGESDTTTGDADKAGSTEAAANADAAGVEATRDGSGAGDEESAGLGTDTAMAVTDDQVAEPDAGAERLDDVSSDPVVTVAEDEEAAGGTDAVEEAEGQAAGGIDEAPASPDAAAAVEATREQDEVGPEPSLEGSDSGGPVPLPAAPVSAGAAEVTREPKGLEPDGAAEGASEVSTESEVSAEPDVSESDGSVVEVSEAGGETADTGDGETPPETPPSPSAEDDTKDSSDSGAAGDALPTLAVPVVPATAEVTREPESPEPTGSDSDSDGGTDTVKPGAVAKKGDGRRVVVVPDARSGAAVGEGDERRVVIPPPSTDVPGAAASTTDGPVVTGTSSDLFLVPGAYAPGRDAPAPERPGTAPSRTFPELLPSPLRRRLPLREGPDGKPRLTPQATLVLTSLAVLALVGVFVAAWAVDSVVHSGRVYRNAELAGHPVGGMSEDDLAAVVADVADQAGQRPVSIVVDGEPAGDEVTAASLGLTLDQDAAIDAAMEAGRGSLPGRPFSWFGSLFDDHTVAPTYTVDDAELASTLGGLYGTAVGNPDEVVAASNPKIELVDGEFTLVAGESGTGLDLATAAEDVTEAAQSADDPLGDIVLEIETSELAPSITDEEAQALVDEANTLTESGLTVLAQGVGESAGTERSLSAEQLRGWITPTVEASLTGGDDGDEGEGGDPESDAEADDETPEELSLQFDTAAADEAVAELFDDIGEDAKNATVEMVDGQIRVVESKDGVACCEGEVGELVWGALDSGEATLELEAKIVEPEWTTAEVEDWGIVEPVGGSRGWQAGAEVPGPRPGYTTWEVGSGGRAHNIGTLATEINGSVIPPGESWSINDNIGARECPPYQEGGAIVEGEHVDQCGGGTSQVATTLLNTAYFAGLDVTGQAHSEHFSRYPWGREATMGAPGTPLDVKIENDTPYGLYIQGARHGNEVTFTIWSTQHIDVKDLGVNQTGTCVTVTNTRERTYPDGSTERDEFSAYYRPGEGIDC